MYRISSIGIHCESRLVGDTRTCRQCMKVVGAEENPIIDQSVLMSISLSQMISQVVLTQVGLIAPSIIQCQNNPNSA